MCVIINTLMILKRKIIMLDIKKTVSLLLAVIMIASLCGCSSFEAGSESQSESETDDLPVIVEPSKKRVAITFDDGPHNVRTKEVVDALDKYGFHATFFVVGNRVDGGVYRGGETLKYVVEHGNEIGIHGYTHTVYYDECSDEEYEYELNETLRAIREYLPGYNVRFMRPVGGFISQERIEASEYSIILWNVDSEDYKHVYLPDSELSEEEKAALESAIVENVMSTVKDGAIILMHDIYLSTSRALEEILRRLYEEGYEVVTVSELLGDPMRGECYTDANG